MGREQCAVVGIGQTRYRKKLELSLDGLVRWAAQGALDDAGIDWRDVDAIVIGKAPDALEGVMMPELSLGDALGAVGKPIHRVHTAGSVGASTAISAALLVESGLYDTVLTVCYEKQSEGNVAWALGGGRSGSQGAGGSFASVDPQLHQEERCARAHRLEGCGEGSPERAAQPERASAPARHLDREGQGIADAVGSAALPRVVPVVGRRGGDGAHQQEWRRAAGSPGSLGDRAPEAHRVHDVPRPRHGEAPGRCRLRRRALQGGRHQRPAQADRLRGDLRAVLVVRADVARGPSHLTRERGLEDDRRGRHRASGRLPGEHVGRRALVEPDRCFRHDPLPRGSEPGARHGRRLPGRRRARCARSRLWRRCQLLRDVDRRFGARSEVLSAGASLRADTFLASALALVALTTHPFVPGSSWRSPAALWGVVI